ncbi:MAG: AAA family ATPase [Treponema sp.]|nr:AAA family ATPase [Treponema sp.]
MGGRPAKNGHRQNSRSDKELKKAPGRDIIDRKDMVVEKLFLDNFRGFSKQYIDILDVNFLVGENSSGKSSVLMALNTISHPGFWVNPEFNTGDSQAYSFDDLVSAETSDKSSFRIGYFQEQNLEIVSFIFEFINLNGKPVISRGAFEKEKSVFYFFCEDDKVKYKIMKGESILPDGMKDFPKNEKFQTSAFATRSMPNSPMMILSVFDFALKNKKASFPEQLPMLNVTPIAPIRSKPKKTYDEPGTLESSEGDHIPYEIRRLLKTKNKFSQEINMFGEQSGLFKNIDIKEYESTDDAPFRMNFILDKEPINIVNIGYGVSQVLPVLFTLLTQKNSMITIQQPEVHLHPKAQAAMGDLFFDLSIGKFKKRSFVETHSDYLIDRFRRKQRQTDEKSNAHVIFFLRKDGINKAFSIKIDDNGNYDADQPEEFREFFIKEQIENLGL